MAGDTPPDDGAPHPADNVVPITGKRPKREKDWRALLSRDEKHKLRASAGNAATILAHDPAWASVLEFDERTGAVLFAKAPPTPGDLADASIKHPSEVTDADLVRIGAWFEREHGVSPGPLSISSAVDAVAHMRSRDPVREFLDGLVWDGIPRIDTWLHVYFGTPDNLYTRGVGAAWLVSAVARTFRPGCQADHMLVLEGAQGIGKSSGLRILAGDSSWFCDGLPGLGTKDAADAIRGPWIVEISELDGFARAELATVKAFVSRTVDRYREAFGRRNHDHPRRVIFAGSTNEHAYLRDHTGARRFWPVRCAAVDRVAIAQDRAQLWAEATARFRAGAVWHPDETLGALAQTEQAARYQGDEWESLIGGYIEDLNEVSVREIATEKECLDMRWDRVDAATQHRIGRCLTRLGWVTNGNPVRRVMLGKQVRVRMYTPPAPRKDLDFGA